MNSNQESYSSDSLEPLLRIENLKKHFPIKGGGYFRKEKKAVMAVDDVSFTIYKGETLGLVGESGCGKSTLGRNILRLQEPTEGRVFFNNTNENGDHRILVTAKDGQNTQEYKIVVREQTQLEQATIAVENYEAAVSMKLNNGILFLH